MRHRSQQMFIACITLASTGCSLMGLDDFGGAPCTSDADCVAAKAELWANKCGPAVCERETGLCAWHEPQETCNGRDDDCDGLIDEGLDIPTLATDAVAAELPVFDYASASASPSMSKSEQTFVAIVPRKGPSEGATLLPASQLSELQYDSATAQNDCPQTVPSTTPPSCNFAEVALAADASHLIVASINTWGCASGQLRVGMGDIPAAPFKVSLGKAAGVQSEEESNIAFGVPLDEEGNTCLSQGSGIKSTPPLGATHPAIASLGTEAGGDGALLVWLAASARGDTASTSAIPVQARALEVPAVKPVWLAGVGQETPTELGQSSTLSTPAVLALRTADGRGNYLVAFPVRREGRDGIDVLKLSGNGGAPDPDSSFLEVGAADKVSLAAGDSRKAEVGLAWLSGSGADSRVNFEVVTTAGQTMFSDRIVSLSASSPPFAPRLLYRPVGFAEEEPRGGWFLSWVDIGSSDQRTFHFARLREGNLEILNDSSTPATGASLFYPGDGDSSVGFASIRPSAGQSNEPETYPLWCHDRG